MARLASTVAHGEDAWGLTALIFDTTPSSRESLRRLLGECQIRSIGVADCVAAREALRTGSVSILICEDLGGPTVTRLRKQVSHGGRSPGIRQRYFSVSNPSDWLLLGRDEVDPFPLQRGARWNLGD
jgi:hypothetical protein